MQEFMPRESSSASQEGVEKESIQRQRPASWSSKTRTGDVTKSDHPSVYEEEIPPYSYPAQDRPAPRVQRQETRTDPIDTQGFSPDGDAFERGYRPYARVVVDSQVPPFARTRRRRRFLFWVFSVLLIIGLIKLLPVLATVVFTLLGIGLFLVLLPILLILVFLLIVAGMVMYILSRMGVPVWQNLFHIRRRSRRRRTW